ncbi:O-methyltransferase [Cytobacillus horneckiae]|uniref:O-methyltransferase n=1 Tax=Cytobacillus horneckiae TaxID=549687 RepID=UPI003D9A8A8A
MSDKNNWKEVEQYFTHMLHAEENDLFSALRENGESDLPPIDVSPTHGKRLFLLAKIKGAKKILEIGTLGGYSTVWMAMALPERGRLFSLEHNPKHIKVARENLKKTCLDEKVEIIEGLAIETLSMLQQTEENGFDFIFIDADKPNNPHYLRMAIELAKDGAVIIGDNVVRDGQILDENTTDPNILGMRSFIEIMAADSRIDSTAIQTVGEKGYDGFTIGVVNK